MVVDLSKATRKTRTVSYRIDSEILEDIAKESKLRETSSNVLINQILRKFTDFDKYQHRVGMIPFPKEVLTSILETVNDEQIKILAQQAFRFLIETVILTQKQQDLAAILHLLKEYVKVSGIASDHIIKGGKDVMVVQHDMGEKCSMFAKELLSLIFEKFVIARPDFEVTDSSVIVTLELPEKVRSHLNES